MTTNRTESDVVDEALSEAPFQMLTFGEGESKMHEPSDFAELLSLDDIRIVSPDTNHW